MNSTHQAPGELPTGVGLTSLTVARLRAAESRRPDRLVDDPFAQYFVTAAGSALAFIEQADPSGFSPEVISAWRVDFLAARTRFFDDYLLGACAGGCRQVVLLAAGLDARAFRLNWPKGLRLFELDVPPVLAFKERVLSERAAMPRCQRTLVSIDLREDWPAALGGAGFLASEPTAWLMEGLLMYLEERDRDRLLDQVTRLSAKGSRLAFDQRYPGEQTKPTIISTSMTAEDKAALDRMIKLGESPDPSVIDPTAWLAGHGWRGRAVATAEQLAAYGRSGPPANPNAPQLPQAWLATGERS